MPSSITEDDSHFEAVQEQMEKAQSSGGSVRSLFTSGYVRTRTSRALRKPIISIYDGIFMIHHVSRTRLHTWMPAPVKCRAMRKHMKAQTKMADEAEGKDLVRVDSQHTDYYCERIHNLSYFTLEVLFIITSRVARSSRAPNPSEVEVLFFRAKSSNHNELPPEFYSVYSCWAHSHLIPTKEVDWLDVHASPATVCWLRTLKKWMTLSREYKLIRYADWLRPPMCI